MNYLLLALACASVGVGPLLLVQRFKLAVIAGAIATLVLWVMFYSGMPTMVYPLYGAIGFSVFVLWLFSAAAHTGLENKASKLWILPVVAAVGFIITTFAGSFMLRSDDYVRVIGPVEKRVWTQDIQPKDPKHMRMGSYENAEYMANKALGEAGAIGSQFQITKDLIRLQKINDELWYVVPLDFVGYSVWLNSGRVPGYIMVHAEDPKRQPVMKMLPDDQKFVYTPGAFFGSNLERHIRSNGYLGAGLTDICLEVDEDGKAWWVAKMFKPTIMWSGEKITKALVVDPVSGEITSYELDKVPAWVDRVIPASYVQSYLEWWGKYQKGWKNTWWGADALTEPEDVNLIYGADHAADWVTGMTSTNKGDESLISVVYMNSRTGKAVVYETKGGSTDTGVLSAVDKNEQVQYKKLHGVAPQLYNIYGTMASVVPLLNENHAFQGVAIVPINNVQQVAVGHDQYEALRTYQRMLTTSGGRVALSNARAIKVVDGVVDRFYVETGGSGTTYGLHISGVPHLFVGGAQELSAPKLPATKIGDKVKVGYIASSESVVPINSFDNLSLELVRSGDQAHVEQLGEAHQDAEDAKKEANTTMEKIKGMSPEELRELGKGLPQPK